MKRERKKGRGKKLVNFHGSTSLSHNIKKQEKERNKWRTRRIGKKNRPFS